MTQFVDYHYFNCSWLTCITTVLFQFLSNLCFIVQLFKNHFLNNMFSVSLTFVVDGNANVLLNGDAVVTTTNISNIWIVLVFILMVCRRRMCVVYYLVWFTLYTWYGYIRCLEASEWLRIKCVFVNEKSTLLGRNH